jgi:hypothetical protein
VSRGDPARSLTRQDGRRTLEYPAITVRYRSDAMQKPFSVAPSRDPTRNKLAAVGASGLVLSLLAGGLATTQDVVPVASVIVGLAFTGIAVVTYNKDPVLALIGLWLFEIFDTPISAMFGYFSSVGEAVRQGNELLVLLFLGLTIWRTLRSDNPIPPLRFILPGTCVGLFGVLGAISHGVSLTITATGALLGLKLWIMVVLTLLLPWTQHDLTRAYNVMMKVGIFIAGLGLVDYLSHGAVSEALHTTTFVLKEGSFRSETVQSIFPNPGEFSLFMSMLFALAFSRFSSRYQKSDLLLAVLFAASVMLSLRLKGVLSLVAVVAIVGAVQGATNSRRAAISLLIGILLFAAVYSVEGNIVNDQISTYTSSKETPRARLYTTGEKIADNNFPLGVGFGRYASYPSRIYYSPVYYQYGLSKVYGLSPTYPNYIDDTSWPSVIGETGYAGFASYLAGLIVLALALLSRLRRASSDVKWVPLAALCSLAVLLVDSLGDPTLFSWLATATLAIVLGPALIASEA